MSRRPLRADVRIQPTEWSGVYSDGSWLYTRNLVPGASVYGETLHVQDGIEYRRWDAERSKLAAYLKKGGRIWPFHRTSSVLYLGAASGTTASHVSDIVAEGAITAVEIAPRPFRDLVNVAAHRSNLIPILADAAHPEQYASQVGRVSILYQDIAQRAQTAIFLRNVDFLESGGTGILMLKARSADVAAPPSILYGEGTTALAGAGMKIMEVRALDPFALDHAAIVARRP